MKLTKKATMELMTIIWIIVGVVVLGFVIPIIIKQFRGAAS